MIRIVHLSIKQGYENVFIQLFEESKQFILSSGCEHVSLLQDNHDTNKFATYSVWDTEEALNAYRASEAFGHIWKTTKAMLQEKPIAQSFSTIR